MEIALHVWWTSSFFGSFQWGEVGLIMSDAKLGPEGPRGPRGERDHDGRRGPTGPTGSSGASGAMGPTGPSSSNSDDTFVGSAVNIGPLRVVGMPVYTTDPGGDQDPAEGDSASTSFVAGVIASFPSFAHPSDPYLVKYAGPLELTVAQWQARTGGVGLATGAIYYLSQGAAGDLITSPANTPGLVTVQIGQALSPTVLLIQIGVPIVH
jgi:Collagen triple helix repeat (20 copies)